MFLIGCKNTNDNLELGEGGDYIVSVISFSDRNSNNKEELSSTIIPLSKGYCIEMWLDESSIDTSDTEKKVQESENLTLEEQNKFMVEHRENVKKQTTKLVKDFAKKHLSSYRDKTQCFKLAPLVRIYEKSISQAKKTLQELLELFEKNDKITSLELLIPEN